MKNILNVVERISEKRKAKKRMKENRKFIEAMCKIVKKAEEADNND